MSNPHPVDAIQHIAEAACTVVGSVRKSRFNRGSTTNNGRLQRSLCERPA